VQGNNKKQPGKKENKFFGRNSSYGKKDRNTTTIGEWLQKKGRDLAKEKKKKKKNLDSDPS